MEEISIDEMDELLKCHDKWAWPYKFDKNKRVCPEPDKRFDVFFME